MESVSGGVATESPPISYLDRKLSGWCTYGACKQRAAEGFQLCSRHRARVNARKAKRTAATRAALFEAGKCVRCRKPSTTYRCPGCRIADGTNLPRPSVADGVATDSDQWRRDGNGWERFRGKGHRGAPGAASTDEADLTEALKSLEKGRHALEYAHSDAVKALGRIARKDARARAAAILAHAARFIDDVVERNSGGEP
jgi:hypothetical protein